MQMFININIKLVLVVVNIGSVLLIFLMFIYYDFILSAKCHIVKI